MNPLQFFAYHSRIVGALFQREMTTRFGREGLGFLWVIGEPLLFTCAVLVMWSILKPAYEHGIRLGPFVMTGYSCLLLLRHLVSASTGTIQGNIGLLHHNQIRVMHLFISRDLMELGGGTASFAVVYILLYSIGQVQLPADWMLLICGWLLLWALGAGLGMIFAGLALRFEVMERLVPVLSYGMIPLSGAFTMMGWFPEHVREIYLRIPFPSAIEMVRGGVFGEFVPTYYLPLYALMWAGILNFAGMVLIADARARIDVE